MTMNNVQENSMNEMMDKIEESMKVIHSGDIVKGKIISVTDEEALVNIGYMTDGVVKKEEVSNYPDISLKEILKENDEIDVYIIKVNGGEGNVVLSKKRADAIKVWDELEDSLKNKIKFNVVVNEIVKGGAVANIKGVRAFIPASHISYSYVENLNKFVGKELLVKVIELDREKRKVILSRKEVEKEEVEAKKGQLWASLKKGEKRKGTVSRLTKFGAFVDLGGVDGLIHLSELSWKRVNHPSEVVSVGDAVEVYVLDFDEGKGRISLGLKDVESNPWNEVENKYKIYNIVEGTVVKVLNFGAFVELEPGVEGLVHVSQISEERISSPADVLNVGDKVKVKIIDINEKNNKISLSIKEAIEKPSEDFSKYNDEEKGMGTLADLFGDKLKDLGLK